jgi:hypothetical protein
MRINILGRRDQSARCCAAGQYACFEWCSKLAVDYNSEWVSALQKPYGQLWVVGEHCSYADEYRVVLAAELVSQTQRRGTAHPPRIAGRGGDLAVKRLRIFHGDKRGLALFAV